MRSREVYAPLIGAGAPNAICPHRSELIVYAMGVDCIDGHLVPARALRSSIDTPPGCRLCRQVELSYDVTLGIEALPKSTGVSRATHAFWKQSNLKATTWR